MYNGSEDTLVLAERQCKYYNDKSIVAPSKSFAHLIADSYMKLSIPHAFKHKKRLGASLRAALFLKEYKLYKSVR